MPLSNIKHVIEFILPQFKYHEMYTDIMPYFNK